MLKKSECLGATDAALAASFGATEPQNERTSVCWNSGRLALGPLPELGFEDFIDVHANPTDAKFVDLDLV